MCFWWVFLVLLIGGVAMEGIIRILVLVLVVVVLVLTRVRVSRTNSVMVVVMVSRVGDLLLREDLLLSWKRAIT